MNQTVLDEHTAAQLESVVDGLVTQTSGTVQRHVIRQEVLASYHALAERATITAFLPVLAGRAARARIERGEVLAGGRAEQQVPSILVLDEHDCTRAQAAAALMRFYAPGRFRVASAGLRPGSSANDALGSLLGEVGLELTDAPEPVDQAAIESVDYIIAIGSEAAEVAEAAGQAPRTVRWAIPAAVGDDSAALVQALRLVEANVRTFLIDIDPDHPLHAPLLAQ
ncbi:MAG: hypothetical protein E6Q90_07550 [Actinobacteria bacterium]|nr:MAG: hypothetical protein E6Q90_07550 [Actinomycetota bacterium]